MAEPKRSKTSSLLRWHQHERERAGSPLLLVGVLSFTRAVERARIHRIDLLAVPLGGTVCYIKSSTLWRGIGRHLPGMVGGLAQAIGSWPDVSRCVWTSSGPLMLGLVLAPACRAPWSNPPARVDGRCRPGRRSPSRRRGRGSLTGWGRLHPASERGATLSPTASSDGQPLHSSPLSSRNATPKRG